MFRVPFFIAIMLAVAFGGGIAISVYALNATSGFGAIRLGAWEAFPQLQTADADPYAKSHRARAGRLLYGTAEGLTFTAKSDDEGQPLEGRCTYTISGQTPASRLWTLFTADEAGMPAPLPADLPRALNARTVLRHPDGSFSIEVSSQARPDNWLAIPPAARFELVLTLFDTPTAGSSGVIDLAMPKIQKTGCPNA